MSFTDKYISFHKFLLITTVLAAFTLLAFKNDRFTLPKDSLRQLIIQHKIKGSLDSAFIGDGEKMNKIAGIINNNFKKASKFSSPYHLILRYPKESYLDIAFNGHDIGINGNHYYTKDNLGDTLKQMLALQSSLDSIMQILYIKRQDSLTEFFLKDSKLHPAVKYYIQDTSATVYLDELNDSIEYKVLGDINSDGKLDSVFLMPELFGGDIGQSFTFTDIHLSRIQTDAYCNHLENLFVIDDIDEDGINEIGLYYSSCASRFKVLRVYTFKSGQWNEAGSVVFDLNYTKPPMQKRIKKIGKGKFAMREITDTGAPDSIVIQDKWLNFEIK